MQLLMTGIEGELTRRIWNAVDRSNPKKWRRTVPERVPHQIGMVRHGSSPPKMGPNRLRIFLLSHYLVVLRLQRWKRHPWW